MMYFDEKGVWVFRLEQDPAFKGQYIAAMGVCQDPTCPCTVVTIACREAELAADVPPENIRFVFSLDLTTRKIVNTPSEQRPPESARFARAFVKELEEKTWVQLYGYLPLGETQVERAVESGPSELPPLRRRADRE